ncbi:hypothetical protein Syun_019918 [Stephania yunnanensis]|uniref:glucan endo-1,3-beta-D-glucosidase n=1 Tax=Stephania yunnanensis TaxID=152371 RepID=A0AAP0IV06_9MAGN
MASLTAFPIYPFLFLAISGCFLLHLPPLMASSLGINYGQIANNLPSPDAAISLIKSLGVSKVKLYDASPQVLHAFANTGVEFVVGLGNEYLSKMRDPDNALQWVKTNVKAYLPQTKITCITIGNEVLTFNDSSLTSNLLPTMQSIYTALQNLGLEKQVSVTTAHSLAILETSYPPSSGAFRRDLKNCIIAILNFHLKTGSPMLINAYPFFAYKANPKQVGLDYVLFQPNQGVLDPSTNLRYDNMLFAQIDAMHTAMANLGFKRVCVQVSETGWPSKGDEDELGASLENAKKYNGNLIKLVNEKKGTPLRPNLDLNVYIFALFNENLKPGPASERNYGLFKPDGTPAYQIPGAAGKSSAGNVTGGTSSGGGSGGPSSSDDQSSSDGAPSGYLSISAASKLSYGGWSSMLYLQGLLLCACLCWFLLSFSDMNSISNCMPPKQYSAFEIKSVDEEEDKRMTESSRVRER